MLLERPASSADRGQQRAGGDGGGSLNVVVEGAQPVTIALEQDGRIDAGEVLPLQKYVRPAALHGGHKLLDERIVLRPADALVLPANVNRIVEAFFVVCAHVEQNRQAMLWRDAAQCGVKGHLADGNAHAARALIAQAENAFAVRDHDAAHIVKTRVGKNLFDAVLVGIAHKKAAWPPPYLAEALASLAYHRRINNGQQLFGVVRDKRVEEGLAVVLHIAHVAVLEEGCSPAVQHPFAAFPLIIERSDVRRQEPMQAKSSALLLGKGSALVEPGIRQQLNPMKMGSDHSAVCLVCLARLAHCNPLLVADFYVDLLARSGATIHTTARRRRSPVVRITPVDLTAGFLSRSLGPCRAGACHSYIGCHGSRSETPVGTKSFTLRVTTVMP